jgi:hypothetical protein
MRQHGFAIDRAIGLPDGERECGTGRCQRLKSQQLKQARGAYIPWIGNDERAIALVARKVVRFSAWVGIRTALVVPTMLARIHRRQALD